MGPADATLPVLALILVLAIIQQANAAPPIDVKPLLPIRNDAGYAIFKSKRIDAPANSIFTGRQNPNPTVPSLWQVIAWNRILGISVAHVPGTDSYLYVGRTRDYGFTDPVQDVISGVFDLATRDFKNVTVYSNSFCGGMTQMHDGRIAVAGGTGQDDACCTQPTGMQGFRVYDHQANALDLPELNMLRAKRWYPTTTLMPDNSILINGGTASGSETGTPSTYFERWNPSTPTDKIPRYLYEPTFYAEADRLFYPAVFVLPTGEAFILQDHVSRILKNDNTFRTNADGSFLSAPRYPAEWKTQFPRMGSAVMTALTYENGYSSVDIVMFGGAPTSNPCAPDPSARLIAANHLSFRLTISWAFISGDWQYTFSPGWVGEDMGVPRVGGDAVLLPNGDSVVMGGAQTGCSCGIVNGYNRANYPALWTVLYQPDRPVNSRYTIMSASAIARVYHGTSVLTTDGDIIVQGCDACKAETVKNIGGKDLASTATFFSPGNNSRFEYRVERFSPPYALDTAAKPRITSLNGVKNESHVHSIAYGEDFSINWAAFDPTQTDIAVTKVSLMAPAAVTHSFNTNQRVVFLEIVRQNLVKKKVIVRMPRVFKPNAILPPQMYKLHIMNGKTYSRAWWVKLSL